MPDEGEKPDCFAWGSSDLRRPTTLRERLFVLGLASRLLALFASTFRHCRKALHLVLLAHVAYITWNGVVNARMRISKFTDEQKELIKQWNAQNPHQTFSLKYCHINVPTLNETVFKEQPIPAPTPYQLAQARRDKMAGLRRSQGKRSDEDFTISVPFKPIIDAMGEEIKKQLQAVLPGIIKPLLKDLVSGSSAAVDVVAVVAHPLCLQVKQQPIVTTPMHRGAAAAAAGSADTRVSFKATGNVSEQQQGISSTIAGCRSHTARDVVSRWCCPPHQSQRR